MISLRFVTATALLALVFVCSCKAVPIPRPEDGAIAVIEPKKVKETIDVTGTPATEIDTLSEKDEHGVRVKRQGGCGCCCCRPCCCCKPCCCRCCKCCCCRCCCCKCCCCRCCCCRPRCCCCRPCCCGCGCGCCGCGGGRKRRSLQNLRIAHLNKRENEQKQIAVVPVTVDDVTPVEVIEESLNTGKDSENNQVPRDIQYPNGYSPIFQKLGSISPVRYLSQAVEKTKAMFKQLIQ